MYGWPFCLPPRLFLLFLHGKEITLTVQRNQKGEEATSARTATVSRAPWHLSPAAARTSTVLTALCKTYLLEKCLLLPLPFPLLNLYRYQFAVLKFLKELHSKGALKYLLRKYPLRRHTYESGIIIIFQALFN